MEQNDEQIAKMPQLMMVVEDQPIIELKDLGEDQWWKTEWPTSEGDALRTPFAGKKRPQEEREEQRNEDSSQSGSSSKGDGGKDGDEDEEEEEEEEEEGGGGGR
ncbi:hypothetical protein WOLCODRAFT_151887 [Wolfiporia cocos MD-104 SS10]|uniref:Uncharacterized protein n=1 Tax=Wolfiporia cocos (strain MD-104) TaxID=742152 RepID=A0A2H3JPL7_WOLCO|nr:hypothetical protein WOLCODRAFT_151887 [Wolfiporia cocos MD-104 SS10]